jgi:hypothetical protein
MVGGTTRYWITLSQSFETNDIGPRSQGIYLVFDRQTLNQGSRLGIRKKNVIHDEMIFRSKMARKTAGLAITRM